MQKVFLVIISLIIGLVIGSWIPRSELRIMKGDIEKLRKDYRECQKNKSESSLMENVTSMLGVSSKKSSVSPTRIETKRKPTPELPQLPPKKQQPLEPEEDGLPPDDYEQTVENLSEKDFDSEEDFQMKLEAARDLWKSRSAHARELVKEDLMLNDEEIRGFDNVITSMNNRLEDEIATIASSIQYKDQLGTEDGLKIAHGITGVLIDTYSELDTVLPQNWRENSSRETDIVNFIDPMVAAPLTQMYVSTNQAETEME